MAHKEREKEREHWSVKDMTQRFHQVPRENGRLIEAKKIKIKKVRTKVLNISSTQLYLFKMFFIKYDVHSITSGRSQDLVNQVVV